MFGRYFIGIDIGTTTFKGAVLDLDQLAIRSVQRIAAPESLVASPRHELDPSVVVDRVRGLIRTLLQDVPEAGGLVMCGQMHGVVFADGEGQAYSNIVTWKDQRAVESAVADNLLETLQRRLTPEELDAIGGELRSGVPIATLAALRAESLVQQGLYAASLPDYVLANLGGRAPTTDPTNAAAHGLYDLDQHDWHRGIIEKLGLDLLRWPEIHSFRELTGDIEIDGKRLWCFTPVGDQQCALAGAALTEGELSLNISTGSQVSLVGSDRPRGGFLVRPYLDGMWLRTLVSVPAGRSLQLLVDLLTEMGSRVKDPWDYIRDVVEEFEKTDLEVELSFFASMTGDRGRIGNIHEGNLSVGHLFAAAFRSMAMNYARCAGTLAPHKGWDRVVFSGSLASRFSRLRRDILAALGNPPCRTNSSDEETLQGLLALALVCDGRAATVAEAGRMLAAKE